MKGRERCSNTRTARPAAATPHPPPPPPGDDTRAEPLNALHVALNIPRVAWLDGITAPAATRQWRSSGVLGAGALPAASGHEAHTLCPADSSGWGPQGFRPKRLQMRPPLPAPRYPPAWPPPPPAAHAPRAAALQRGGASGSTCGANVPDCILHGGWPLPPATPRQEADQAQVQQHASASSDWPLPCAEGQPGKWRGEARPRGQVTRRTCVHLRHELQPRDGGGVAEAGRHGARAALAHAPQRKLGHRLAVLDQPRRRLPVEGGRSGRAGSGSAGTGRGKRWSQQGEPGRFNWPQPGRRDNVRQHRRLPRQGQALQPSERRPPPHRSPPTCSRSTSGSSPGACAVGSEVLVSGGSGRCQLLPSVPLMAAA